MAKIEVQTIREGARGCGYKKEGGLYLVSEGIGADCCKLPIKLDVCPTCGHGIKPSRGFTWINLRELIKGKRGCEAKCLDCPLGDIRIYDDQEHLKKVGLLWIGGKYYTPNAWIKESELMGASRRIPAIPKDFVLGETWVCVAHREYSPVPPMGKMIVYDESKTPPSAYELQPMIFHIFKPTAIQYVVTGKEGQKKLKRMIKRGITPVRIERLGENGKLFKEKKKPKRKKKRRIV